MSSLLRGLIWTQLYTPLLVRGLEGLSPPPARHPRREGGPLQLGRSGCPLATALLPNPSQPLRKPIQSGALMFDMVGIDVVAGSLQAILRVRLAADCQVSLREQQR